MTGERPTLDLDFVRAQFPAFSHPDSRDWVHFENAGGSYVPTQVIDILTTFYTASKVQPYGPAGPAKAAGDAMDRARALVPATFNAAEDEVHFGPSTSQNTYVLAQALRALLADGDEIVVTNQDHEANIGAWRRLAETGITVTEWAVDSDTGLLDLDRLRAIVSERTRLVCVTHASNLAATINPVAEIAAIVHGVGGLLVVDGVAWAPHAAIDVTALDCDLYLYSTYKTYGPHQGLVYCRREVLDRLANQGHYFNADNPRARIVPAGPDHASIAACAGIVDYHDALYDHHFPTGDAPAGSAARLGAVFDLIADQEEELMAPMLDFLTAKGVRIVGSASPSRAVRAPTIAFVSDRTEPPAIVEALAAAGIGIGDGHFYAKRLAEAIGLPGGVTRLSMVHYNTVAEVERAIEALDPLL